MRGLATIMRRRMARVSAQTHRLRAVLRAAGTASHGRRGSLTFVSAAAIPPNFFVVQDQDGANDVPAQVDMTQMGRDDTDPDVYRLFWSWDATDQWTGTGSTGDACALFDANGNGRIDYVVCGQVHNTSPTVVVQTVGSPFAFSCNDVRFDRCGQPDGPLPYTPAQIQAGVLTSRCPRPESAREPDHGHRSVPQPRSGPEPSERHHPRSRHRKDLPSAGRGTRERVLVPLGRQRR